MKIILFITALFISILSFSQSNINVVLKSIEENSTNLIALREQSEALKLENKTEFFFANPEFEFNYLWGSADLGNRKDIKISQSFDIGTIIGLTGKLSKEKNTLVDLQYKANRINILLQAKEYCIDLIYYNALQKELDLRLRHAKMIAEGYKERLNSGDANILEYNKVQLNFSAVQGESAKIKIERKALLAELKRLNAGNDIVFDDSSYDEILLPLNFEEWFAMVELKNPMLQYVKQEIEVERKRLSLAKSGRLPKFSAGYMREQVVDHDYQGLTLDFTIPLWENKNKVKQAKQALRAAEFIQADRRQEFYGELNVLYERAKNLNDMARDYRSFMDKTNSTELLKKALETGEISLLEYIVEIGLYYNTIKQTLDTERDFQKTYAKLSAFEL